MATAVDRFSSADGFITRSVVTVTVLLCGAVEFYWALCTVAEKYILYYIDTIVGAR